MAVRVAVEVEGGAFIQGRHSRGAGFLKDMEKYNTLACLGYRLIRVTPRQMANGEALTWCDKALRGIQIGSHGNPYRRRSEPVGTERSA